VVDVGNDAKVADIRGGRRHVVGALVFYRQ
jgi:hypothetical protein